VGSNWLNTHKRRPMLWNSLASFRPDDQSMNPDFVLLSDRRVCGRLGKRFKIFSR
jgi:hypothetical protein